MKKSRLFGAVCACTFIFFLITDVMAAPIVFQDSDPNADTFTDCTPGCTPIFQQLYSASHFSGPVTISNIQFEYLNGHNETYTFSLSTSAATIGGLSSTFANNIGVDNQVFYSGVLIQPDANNIAIFTSAAFQYDPTQGNLLLDIRHENPGIDTLSTYINNEPIVQRVLHFSDMNATIGALGDIDGLKTTFNVDVSPVPIPPIRLALRLWPAGAGWGG